MTSGRVRRDDAGQLATPSAPGVAGAVAMTASGVLAPCAGGVESTAGDSCVCRRMQRKRRDIPLFVNGADVAVGSAAGKRLAQVEHRAPHGLVGNDTTVPHGVDDAVVAQQFSRDE